jgi:hypothetical protein
MEKMGTHIHAQEIIPHGFKAAINHGIKTVAEEDISFQPSGIIKLALKEQSKTQSDGPTFTKVASPKSGNKCNTNTSSKPSQTRQTHTEGQRR